MSSINIFDCCETTMFQDASGLNGSMDIVDEGDDGKARAAIEHIQGKIVRTKDLIKGEQNARDG